MDGVEMIAAERRRQIEQEDWKPTHDDTHEGEELARAAAIYAMPDHIRRSEEIVTLWPWELDWWKPTPHDRVRELIKAGALIAAEIDRLLRAALAGAPPPNQKEANDGT
jgi:hypothetical protein